MFRKEMLEKLSRIFQFQKTTYDVPSESFEQDVLFVDIEQATSRVTTGNAFSKVIGSLTVYSNKVPFGYFNKKIGLADPILTKNFVFFDIDLSPASSPARFQNITERRVRFVYLYKAQYDPNHGELNELEFT